MTVVIPTGQYANIQPKVVGVGYSFEEAQADALNKANSFYGAVDTQAEFKLLNKVVAPVAIATTPEGTPVPLKSDEMMKDWFSGHTVYRNKEAHSYLDDQGNSYLSGSKFAKEYTPQFNKDLILPNYAKKNDVRESEVEALWEAKGMASTTWGTALHQALETYGKFYHLNVKLGKDPLSVVPPTMRPIVAKFFTEERLKSEMVFEMFVTDELRYRCGEMDLVTIVDKEKKILDIEDYKTNADLFKLGTPKNMLHPFTHLPNMDAAKYTLQLSFYADIVESRGWTVRSIKLHHFGGDENVDPNDIEWVTTELRRENTTFTHNKPAGNVDLSAI